MQPQLQQALEHAPRTPCVRFWCPNVHRCASGQLACDAWIAYVRTGRSVSPFMVYDDPRRPMALSTTIVADSKRFRISESAA